MGRAAKGGGAGQQKEEGQGSKRRRGRAAKGGGAGSSYNQERDGLLQQR